MSYGYGCEGWDGIMMRWNGMEWNRIGSDRIGWVGWDERRHAKCNIMCCASPCICFVSCIPAVYRCWMFHVQCDDVYCSDVAIAGTRLCPVNGLRPRYMDPVTNIPYDSLSTFHTIRQHTMQYNQVSTSCIFICMDVIAMAWACHIMSYHVMSYHVM